MGYNYYNYGVYLEKRENISLEKVKETLGKFKIEEETSNSLTLSFDGWKLWIHLAKNADVEAEAQEMAEWKNKPVIADCDSRLEICAEDDPDEVHYNDHLYVIEAISGIRGTHILDPVLGEFLYE